MHASRWCENKSQSAVTSDKCLLGAGDTRFKTLMKFFSSCLVLHLFGSCSCKALWILLHFLPINPIYFSFFINFFPPPSCRYVFCLKAGTPRQAIHRVWMCSDTSSSRGLISQGKIGVWHVYILFPFLCRITKKKKNSFLFPTALQTRCSLRENRCWPVS